MDNPNARLVALDVGTKRIGIATANVVARLASPLQTINVDKEVFDHLAQIFAEQTACQLVVGLPRGLNGQDTEQTAYTRDFVTRLQRHTSLPVGWQDEAVTSRLSEDSLKAKGKPYSREQIDALAACYILEDWLAANPPKQSKRPEGTHA